MSTISDLVLEDDYYEVLSSISEDMIISIVKDIRHTFKFLFNCDYGIIGENTRMAATLRRMRKFVNRERPHLLVYFMSSKCNEYATTCPCTKCKFNDPCEVCGVTNPFDIFVKNSKYKFLYSCRPSHHMCLLCFAKHNPSIYKKKYLL